MEAQDYTVRIRSIATVPVVTIGGEFVSKQRISIMVGPFGPFTKDFPSGQDNAAQINQWKLDQQAHVRLISQEV